MRGDQIVVHVAGMAGAVAQPRDAGDFGDATQQPPERPDAAGPFAVIGIDVLSDQRDLAHAGVGKSLRPHREFSPTGRETSTPRV